MNQLLESDRRDRSEAAPRPAIGNVALIAGLVLTLAGLGYAILDQTVLHGLDNHLHALYDPVGKSAQSTPLYAYLYSVAGLGIVVWLVTLRLARSGVRWVRRWNIGVLIVAALAIMPLFLSEYGQPVFGLQLSGWFVVSWVLGLVATITLRPRLQYRY